MRYSLLAVVALLAAAGVAAETPVAEEEAALVARQLDDAEKALALPMPTNDKLQKARQGLDAVKKFIDIFTADIFKGTKVGIVAEILSKTLSFVIAFMDLFGGKQESAELRYMRIQFAETHARLNSIDLQIKDVKNLIDWTGTRVMYFRLEQHIVTASKNFDEYMKTKSDFWKRQFLEHFKTNQQAAYEIYRAVVETDQVIGSNLATAVVHFTKNHKRQSMNFLLSLNRLILRGAQMQVAYEGMVDSEAAATQKEGVWKQRMTRLASRLKQVDDQIERAYHSQLQTDVQALINEGRNDQNKDFVGRVYRFVADKFHWRYWIVLAYKNVGGWDNHAITHCGSAVYFRTAGDRNVVVASSDKKGTRFNRANAERVLAAVDGTVRNRNAKEFLDAINGRVGNYCHSAALRAAVCWGCDVWFISINNRRVYRKMTAQRGGNMNTLLFG